MPRVICAAKEMLRDGCMFIDIVWSFAICVGGAQTVVHDVENRKRFPVCRTEVRHETTKAKVQMNIRHANIQMNIMVHRTDRVADLMLYCTGVAWVALEYPILDSCTEIMHRPLRCGGPSCM